MSATTASEQGIPAPAPEIERSGPPTVSSRVFAIVLRLTLRPWIAFNVWLCTVIVRFGPKGVEKWRVWERLVALTTDSLGRVGPLPSGTTVERVDLPACAAELVRAPGVTAGSPYILYFHGGGYVACGLASHRRLVARLSKVADATVFNVAYRLLPRAAITVALEDAVDGYRRLLEDGLDPGQIVFAGDSAGGGLAFRAAVAARDAGLPVPAGVVGISPWVDLDPTAKLTHRNVRSDPLIPAKAIASIAEVLIAEDGAIDPLLSPVNLDLTGMPPALIHVGTTEILELDALALGDRLVEAGVPARVKLWEGQVHDFHLLGLDFLPEARQAIAEIGEFVREVTAT